VVSSEGDRLSLFWATHYMARARATIRENTREDWAEPLRDRLLHYQPSNEVDEILSHVTQAAVGRIELTGCLLLLSDIAECVNSAALHVSIVPAIIGGLHYGWSFSGPDPAKAACTVLTFTHPLLQVEDADQISRALVQIIPSTPAFRLEDAYVALAQSVIMSAPIPDGGNELSQLLLAARARALNSSTPSRPPNYLSALGVALAAVAERSNDEIKAKLINTLVEEADAGRWDGLATLAARGAALDQTISDRYLRLIVARLRNLMQAPDSATAFGFVPADDSRMRRYVANAASTNAVKDAIKTLLAFVNNDAHWSINRASWMDLLAHLLLAHPDMAAEAKPVVMRLASGEYREPGDVSNLISNHVLSAMRFDFGAASNLRAKALTVLGAICGGEKEVDSEDIRRTLIKGASDSSEDVRTGAIVGIGESAKRHGIDVDWARYTLTRALSDIDPVVAKNAKEYLQAINDGNQLDHGSEPGNSDHDPREKPGA
jgi:hypothetical protein